jgi:hypothetical protein
MSLSHAKATISFASAILIGLCSVVSSSIPANAQARRVSCGDPRVKDALMLAVLERYKDTLGGRQIREVGRMGPGHVGFTPEGHSICSMWVNFQTSSGQTMLYGTARFEIYEDGSGNVVASLL